MQRKSLFYEQKKRQEGADVMTPELEMGQPSDEAGVRVPLEHPSELNRSRVTSRAKSRNLMGESASKSPERSPTSRTRREKRVTRPKNANTSALSASKTGRGARNFCLHFNSSWTPICKQLPTSSGIMPPKRMGVGGTEVGRTDRPGIWPRFPSLGSVERLATHEGSGS